tara:strand:- start:3175 stop:3726 length:552 start_codon:yes stop_codon:yes gene_type:complete
MAWTAPRTWVTAELVTAALLNTHLRDNLLQTIGAVLTTRGDLATRSASASARVALGTTTQVASSDGTDLVWTGAAVFGVDYQSEAPSNSTVASVDLQWGEATVATGGSPGNSADTTVTYPQAYSTLYTVLTGLADMGGAPAATKCGPYSEGTSTFVMRWQDTDGTALQGGINLDAYWMSIGLL